MLLGLRSNFHSAVSEVKMTDRHLKGAIRQGEVMDTHKVVTSVCHCSLMSQAL